MLFTGKMLIPYVRNYTETPKQMCGRCTTLHFDQLIGFSGLMGLAGGTNVARLCTGIGGPHNRQRLSRLYQQNAVPSSPNEYDLGQSLSRGYRRILDVGARQRPPGSTHQRNWGNVL